MYLPEQSILAAEAHFQQQPGSFTTFLAALKPSTGGWSSLIGVVTAIVGNILISFALNTQRYAHLRMARDRAGAAHEKRRISRKQRASSDSGTESGRRQEQADIAEDRARANAEVEIDGRLSIDEYHDDSVETDPLIPHVERSRSSEDTARAEEDGDRPPREEKSYLRSPIWWLGIALMAVGEAGNFLAYGFAPASIVSPLGVVALVSNCLIAPWLLGERFRWRDGLGVLIAIAGCVVVVLSASASNPKLDADAIWDLITRWEFETYFGISLFLIIVLAVASSKFGDRSIFVDLGLVGLFGGYTALSTKGIASLLSNKIWRVITFPITYLLLFVLISTAILQVKYVNRALQRFNATMVIPTQFVLFTLSVIIGSAVLYRDFEREQTDDSIKFVCGCALTFFGVWCITSGHKKDTDPDEEEEDLDEDPDAIKLIDDESVISEIRSNANGVGSASHRTPVIRHHTIDAIPQTLRRSSSQAQQPENRLVTPLIVEPAAPSVNEVSNIAPANAAAVHADSATQINDENRKPAIHATTSAPIVPTATTMHSLQDPSSLQRPVTPLSRTVSGPTSADAKSPHRSLGLHAEHSSSTPHLEPTCSTTNPHNLRDRHSVIGLFPGPLTSPLSYSLSAIVADELRRGIDRPLPSTNPSGSLRHRSTRSLALAPKPPTITSSSTNSNHAAAAATDPRHPRRKRHSIASGTERDFSREVLLNEEVGDEDQDTPGPHPSSSSRGAKKTGRLRSLSATLGEIFGSASPRAKQQQQLERARTQEQQPDADGNGNGNGSAVS